MLVWSREPNFAEMRTRLMVTIMTFFRGNFFRVNESTQRVPLPLVRGGAGQFTAPATARAREFCVAVCVVTLASPPVSGGVGHCHWGTG